MTKETNPLLEPLEKSAALLTLWFQPHETVSDFWPIEATKFVTGEIEN
jgi:hypothetical protein